MRKGRLSGSRMSMEERREKRRHKRTKDVNNVKNTNDEALNDEEVNISSESVTDGRIADMLMRNEDELLKFVAKINKVYQEKLKKPAPFMTFVLCGMQSTGKSTIMERFMSAVLNIVQEGTGTRCPLDTTCIHDDSCEEPRCDLSGEELDLDFGEDLTVDEVFEHITGHNKRLGKEDRFSTSPLYLVYRAKNVQNMRFVDTPGIISNSSTGKDNRDDIKMILKSEMKKPNTKLCVLLEPKEFATNPIVDFCDETLGGRSKWVNNSTVFLMTKFDKQLEDSRTINKANNFFKEFNDNGCYPHLVITPTLPKEDLPTEQLLNERKELLAKADELEKNRFDAWLEGHDLFRQQLGDSDNEMLRKEIQEKIGFASAKKAMREIMLEDTARRLPEVLSSLRRELAEKQKEEMILLEKDRFSQPNEIKVVVSQVLWAIQDKLFSYLDGNLEISRKFPERLQTLDDELEEEEESEWCPKELNHHTTYEDDWRDQIAKFEGEYPKEVQADKRFIGGKQVQRAIEFFKAVVIDALPDPFELREEVASATGYLRGGLQYEDWENATTQITRVCVKQVTHPGINFLIKHVGSIFRRLFSLALDDIKLGEEFSNTFKLLPPAIERHLLNEFDEMLWDLMYHASEKTHCALEPMYSTIDPNLPTFHPRELENDEEERDNLFELQNGQYVQKKSRNEIVEEGFVASMKSRLASLCFASVGKAKDFLKQESHSRATAKKSFLPDKRSSMINNDEIDKILTRSFEYIIALMEFNLVTLKFQVNHYLYEGFKIQYRKSFHDKIMHGTNWGDLVRSNDSLKSKLAELKLQIASLKESLNDVQRMQRTM